MRDSDQNLSFEATVRRAFDHLTAEDLPRAAAARGWALRSPQEFEHLLLGHLAGCDDRRDCCLVDLVLAVELGGQLLAGTLCCDTMLARLRGECDGAEPQRQARRHH